MIKAEWTNKDSLDLQSTVDKEGRTKAGAVIFVPKDYVQIVRCKDCKHWEVCDEEDGISYGQCMNPLWVISNTVFLNEDWYCADGERKEE